MRDRGRRHPRLTATFAARPQALTLQASARGGVACALLRPWGLLTRVFTGFPDLVHCFAARQRCLRGASKVGAETGR